MPNVRVKIKDICLKEEWIYYGLEGITDPLSYNFFSNKLEVFLDERSKKILEKRMRESGIFKIDHPLISIDDLTIISPKRARGLVNE